MKIYTVGYEGCDIDQFTLFLKANKINLVADVRKNPVSRKKGFSKKRLAENLQLRDIAYEHFPGLGVPTAWRKAAKEETITRKKMFSDYVKKILPLCDPEFSQLMKLATKRKVAVLCYEADAFDCHRKFVVEKLGQLYPKKLTVVHLVPNPPDELRSLGMRELS